MQALLVAIKSALLHAERIIDDRRTSLSDEPIMITLPRKSRSQFISSLFFISLKFCFSVEIAGSIFGGDFKTTSLSECYKRFSIYFYRVNFYTSIESGYAIFSLQEK